MIGVDRFESRVHSRAILYFNMIRQCGSIREASRRLGVAASAINRQLIYLEAEIGAPLFDRLPTGMRLTSAGEVMARHAIAVLQDAQRTASDFDALRGLRRGRVSLITVEGVNSDFLPSVVGQALRRYPAIEIETRSAGSNAIASVVAAGDADIGLAFSLPFSRDLQQRAVGKFSIGAVMKPDHPLARGHRLTFGQCAKYPLILSGPELSIHTLMEPLLRRHGGEIKSVVRAASIELMKSLALQGHGIAFQTRVGLEAEVRDGLLVHIPLESPALVSELGAYVRAGRPMPVAVEAFIQILRSELQSREEGVA